MNKILALLSAAMLAVPAAAQEAPRFTLEHRMQLRCSAVFAIVAGEQARGVASAAVYPPLGERGREYFARTGARLIDDLKLTRAQVEASMRTEAAALQKEANEAPDRAAYIDSLMQPCLSALEASGL
jgi:hypothetical protein